MGVRAWAAVAVGVALAASGCTSSGETEDLEAQLAQVSAERDALQAQVDAVAARYEKTQATKAAVETILADQDSYGTVPEVADLLASYATPDAVMDDDVFGAIGYRQAWYSTLGGDLDARIDTIQQWVDADGSEAGALWVWRGVNGGGHPFELIGISVISYDDDGLVTNEWVAYPYPDAFVVEAIDGAGTPTTITGDPWPETDDEG